MKILLLSLLLLKTDQTNFIEKSTDLMDQGLIIVDNGRAKIDNWRYYSCNFKNHIIKKVTENENGIQVYFTDNTGFWIEK